MDKKRKSKKIRLDRVLILILLVVIIIAVIMLVTKRKEKVVETVATQENTENGKENNEENSNNIENQIQENSNNTENQIQENGNKKIDFLANLDVPVYKKNEKNIKIPVLIYHNFRTPIPYEQDIYKLFSSLANFEENVKTLIDNGYTFITLEDLYRYNNNEIGLPEKVIIITMDDGHIGCYTDAFPVLKKYNVPATIFVVNTLVGTEDYFSWEQAKEMYSTGLVQIHCHGYNHSEYSSVGKEKLISDYTKSHQEIEEHMGEKIQKIMAYPAGKSSQNTIKWLKEIGFEVQVQTRYGTVNKSNNLDLTNLGRIRAERATGSQILSSINSGGI